MAQAKPEEATSSLITIARRLEFDAGHRVKGHEGKCATLHGHRYSVWVTAQAKALDNVGRVIDFGVIKQLLGTWIDLHWDHTCLVFDEDTEVLTALKLLPRNKEPYVCPFNPTAENMARYLLRQVCPNLFKDTGVSIVKVRVDETPNCYAEVCL